MTQTPTNQVALIVQDRSSREKVMQSLSPLVSAPLDVALVAQLRQVLALVRTPSLRAAVWSCESRCASVPDLKVVESQPGGVR